ncbi:MAG: site-specific integrase [Gallionellaceae bacterium]|jgi:integrase
MNKGVAQFLADRATLPLPRTARTRSGIKFSPNATKISFRDGNTRICINFKLLPDLCPQLELGLRKTILWYFENRAPRTANSGFTRFLTLARFLASDRREPIQHIGTLDILAFKMSSKKAEHILASIRGFLIKWCALSSPGIDQEVAYFLRSIKIRQHPVGVAVATLDSNIGPLTDFEFEAIQSALNNAYAHNQIKTENLLQCYLLMSLGIRPVQLASLKCGDLIEPQTPDGDYMLKVPRAKQHGQLARDEFKLRRLTCQIGDPLSTYVASIRAEFSNRIEDTNHAPMFPQRKQVKNANEPGFKYHAVASTLSGRFRNLFISLQVPSDRLEIPISMTPIRFRRTFATRAAEEGWPLLVLAELMDHSNTKHVKVYAGLTTRIRAKFSRKIALEMAPLAMAFSGRIINSEGEATRPGSSSRIIDLRINKSGASMGSCGSHAHCGFARPYSCYGGCYDFEPWLDGPHEAVLDYMLARRKYLVDTTDPKIASINDRSILGCAQVILRCRQIIKKEKM